VWDAPRGLPRAGGLRPHHIAWRCLLIPIAPQISAFTVLLVDPRPSSQRPALTSLWPAKASERSIGLLWERPDIRDRTDGPGSKTTAVSSSRKLTRLSRTASTLRSALAAQGVPSGAGVGDRLSGHADAPRRARMRRSASTRPWRPLSPSGLRLPRAASKWTAARTRGAWTAWSMTSCGGTSSVTDLEPSRR
jgi:hypothetical protein